MSDETKKCKKCKKRKPLDKFYTFKRQSGNGFYTTGNCKQCISEREFKRKWSKDPETETLLPEHEAILNRIVTGYRRRA